MHVLNFLRRKTRADLPDLSYGMRRIEHIEGSCFDLCEMYDGLAKTSDILMMELLEDGEVIRRYEAEDYA